MYNYELLCQFLRRAESAFASVVDDASEFGYLADKFERGDATGDDLKLVQRILKNADEHIRQTPTCETRDEVLLIINMLQAQVDIDLGALD